MELLPLFTLTRVHLLLFTLLRVHLLFHAYKSTSTLIHTYKSASTLIHTYKSASTRIHTYKSASTLIHTYKSASPACHWRQSVRLFGRSHLSTFVSRLHASPKHKAIYSKNTSIYILRPGLPCQKYLSLPSALAVRLTDIRMDHPFSPSVWRRSVSALRLREIVSAFRLCDICLPSRGHPSSFSGTSVSLLGDIRLSHQSRDISLHLLSLGSPSRPSHIGYIGSSALVSRLRNILQLKSNE